MLGFLKKFFFTAMTFCSCSALKCVSMNNQECKIRPVVINIISTETLLYRCNILVNKCSGSCNDINNFYAKLCVLDVVKNMNVKVFNLISRINETRQRKWHETCKCICRLDASFCNNKQRWNNDKYRCEFKELIDKGTCDAGFNWNPSKCECECDTGEYLNYEKFDKLVEACTENIDEKELIYNGTLNSYGNVCNSCTIYIVLLIKFFLISIGISCAFVYFYWYLKKDNANITNINANTETVIY